MSVIDFDHMVNNSNIWKSIPFNDSTDRKRLYNFIDLIDQEGSIYEADNKAERHKNVSEKLIPFKDILNIEDLANDYIQYSYERKKIWLKFSLALHHKQLTTIIDEESLKEMEIVCNKKHPTILCPFHLGPYSLVTILPTIFNREISVLVNDEERGLLSDWAKNFIEHEEFKRMNLLKVPSMSSPLRFLKNVMKNHIGIIFPEFSYGIGKEFERVNFFGKTMNVPTGVYTLSKKANAKVIPMTCYWENNKIHFAFGREYDPSLLNASAFLNEIFSFGETYIKAYKEQWFWELVDMNGEIE
ncbi:LpxL/LpxP family acyltransferase [Bacillus sp. 2205SS5-2]|uniref:LpxL/LpxP family acyltransferase n=1 Tax=Bacillus sp. 2205SS5-2 TaxID=3109031 RepID=UPI0030065442